MKKIGIKKYKGKKGFELAISTIVLLVLGIVVLIALILIFTGQMKNFFEFIGVYSPNSNIDIIKTACNSFVQTEQQNAFCCEKQDVVFDSGKESLTCAELAGKIDGIENMSCGRCF